jgi:nitrite reductase/ring-hydroxylating ferredoxin subunit
MTTQLGPLTDFVVDEPTQVTIDGETYLVIRRAQSPEEVCVVRDRCPHAGLSLSRGPRGGYEDGVITCPWHNSRFDVCSGENLDWAPGFAGIKAPGWSRRLIAMGKSPAPLTVLAVSVRDGQVVVDDE